MKYVKQMVVAVALFVAVFLAVQYYNKINSRHVARPNPVSMTELFTVVTDGKDFRLRGRDGRIYNEVFSTKQEAIDYINQMDAAMNPAKGKDYQPAQ